MAENDIEKISNIDKISQENSGENKLKKQEKTKTTKTTLEKVLLKRALQQHQIQLKKIL